MCRHGQRLQMQTLNPKKDLGLGLRHRHTEAVKIGLIDSIRFDSTRLNLDSTHACKSSGLVASTSSACLRLSPY
jgi:hypothetical protein